MHADPKSLAAFGPGDAQGAHPAMTKRNMTDRSDIIEEHLLGRKLIGVWETIRGFSPTTVEG